MSNEARVNVTHIQKHDTEANWKLSNLKPDKGQIIIYDPDEAHNYSRQKIGDGVTNVNDLPFSTQQADWNQNDENAADYIKNRTHYTTETTAEEVLCQEYIDDKYPDNYNFITTLPNIDTNNSIGETWKVILTSLSGTEYSYTGIIQSSSFGSHIGNTAVVTGYSGSGDPYCIIGNELYCIEAYGAITVSKEILAEEVKQLDEKYIPDTIARVNELPNIGINTTIEGEGASAFGIESIARGDATHAEGYQVLAGSKSFKFNLEHEYTENDINEGWYYLTSVDGLSYVVDQTQVEENITFDINTIGNIYLESSRQNPEAWTYDHSNDIAIYDARLAINSEYVYPYILYIQGNVSSLSGFDSGLAQFFRPILQDGTIRLDYLYNNGDGFIYVSSSSSVVYRVDGIRTLDNPQYSMRLESNYDFNGEVIEVDETLNRVKVTNYRIPVVGTSTEISEFSFFLLPEYPSIGTENIVGYGAHAEGYETIAHSTGAHAEGYATLAAGRYSHAEGRQTKAGYAGHAEGWKTFAKGEATHAENFGTEALGYYSHAEGFTTKTNGRAAHAEGENTVASGNRAHAEGMDTLASGINSHVEGNLTKATGAQAHAEGQETEATGNNSHAEGKLTKAQGGDGAHAEGFRTEATGNSSHAEGRFSYATGVKSHAEGTTRAASEAQHTQGKYNKIDDKGIYADIIGNGTSDSEPNRSNAATVDWKGNAWYSGDVYVGGTHAYDNGAGIVTDAERLVKKSELDNALENITPPTEIPYATVPFVSEGTGPLFNFDTVNKIITVKRDLFFLYKDKSITIAKDSTCPYLKITGSFQTLIYDHGEKTSTDRLKCFRVGSLKTYLNNWNDTSITDPQDRLSENYSIILVFNGANASQLKRTDNMSYKGEYSVDEVSYNKYYDDTAIKNVVSTDYIKSNGDISDTTLTYAVKEVPIKATVTVSGLYEHRTNSLIKTMEQLFDEGYCSYKTYTSEEYGGSTDYFYMNQSASELVGDLVIAPSGLVIFNNDSFSNCTQIDSLVLPSPFNFTTGILDPDEYGSHQQSLDISEMVNLKYVYIPNRYYDVLEIENNFTFRDAPDGCAFLFKDKVAYKGNIDLGIDLMTNKTTNIEEAITNKFVNNQETYNVYVCATNNYDYAWNYDASKGYSKRVYVPGILPTDNPIVDVILENDRNKNKDILTAWENITRITTMTDFIIVWADWVKPTTDITIQLKVVR